MKDRLFLILYLAALVLFTSLHDPRILGGALITACFLAGRDALRLLRRTALTAGLFSGIVSLSYFALGAVQGDIDGAWLLRFNLRVMLLAFLTHWLVLRIKLISALGFSPALRYLLSLAVSEALSFRRIADDFRLAQKSRSLTRPALKDSYRRAGASASYMLRKSFHEIEAITQAMKSRGFGS